MKIKEAKLSGTEQQIERSYETAHKVIAQKAAEEGMVLLKNDGILPLQKGMTISLYGSGARQTKKGGTGSGDVNERNFVTIEAGLEQAGFQIADKKWMDTYDQVLGQARKDWVEDIKRTAQEQGIPFIMAYFNVPFHMPEENPIDSNELGASEVVVYVISRIAGEGADRKNEKGDFLISDSERINLELLQQAGKDVVLLINTGGLIDLTFTEEFTNIKSIVYMMQGGMEGGTAIGRILSGEVTPSGKLTDTWAESYEEWQCADSFGANNGNLEKEYYTEGIFVGYRWFDASGAKVRYPFGYGLSYTDFTFEVVSTTVSEGKCKVSVKVQNNGNTYSGREVIQVYVALPAISDVVREPKKLTAFAKTKQLEPNEQEVVELTFKLCDLARFDEMQSAWLVDAGVYQVLAGNSAANIIPAGTLNVVESCVVEETKPVCPLREKLEEWSPAGKSEIVVVEDSSCIIVTTEEIVAGVVAKFVVEDNQTELEKKAEQIADCLTEEQWIKLVCGKINDGAGQLGAASQSVPGAAGETVSFTKEDGAELANIILADGPAGLRVIQHYQTNSAGEIYTQSAESSFEGGIFSEPVFHENAVDHYQYCTAFPIGTLLAQTWDVKVAEEVGRAVGEEMEEFQVTLWLAPGMNIHRNPLCGRNFEYYSEDPFLTGCVAAAITKGVQSQSGVGTTIKHFACNNQEDNRIGVDSIISERALREIYLKGFEIAVREAQPFSIMTSYNKINGIYSANNYDLCTQIARNEWGFEGLIMTDWTTTINGAESYQCIKAGNDLIMPGMPSDHENIRKALQDGKLTSEELKKCVQRIIQIVLKSNRYE
ncbi:glycoside hydrolase family 3 protein [Anaerosporobacter sp.]|uniref:glycoside hydrolase family 3 protein n=1 Tax=Anaerosporobacter sp. TaxID=1872529 RepID=UPI00286F5E91|nr:glycoside hydrolase family 3 N-terminal domain-containing protein [Anaerosporobacter sp.]